VTQTANHGTGAIRSGDDVRIMFGRITRRYDLMNRIMTGGRDVAWRRLAVGAALAGHARGTARVLDVATGTGDLALALERAGAGFVAGLDFSPPMLEAALGKSRAANRDRRGKPAWILGDALRLPFPDGAFDACTVGFGLRNMPDYFAALAEMARVIRPGGRLVCLEMTPLRAPLIGGLFGWHFEHVVPFVGGLVSGDRDAYRYLPQSVAAFPDAPTLATMMRSAGFADVSWRTLGAGTVALHVAVKTRN
jgi:demethylmenaquinone methyltransferase/2-methoxy-6-polyprenyl-1,4-benzoquinol methylase